MHFVYILYPAGKDKYYIGASASPSERLKKHNAKHTGFTGTANDWTTVFQEEFTTQQEALLRERQLKGWKNRVRIEGLVNKTSSG